MFRLLWLTFFGASRMDAKTERHVHESPPSMTGILVVLAVLSAIGGFVAIPHFLQPLLPMPDVRPGLEPLETTVVVASVVLALVGLLGAAWLYGGKGARAGRLAKRFAALHRLLSGKYFVDEIYDRCSAGRCTVSNRLPAPRRRCSRRLA
jgi:NADH-quinone oxidoreductase subunit L